jgi:hypothetical protein
MPATYEPISTQTLTVAAADVYFNSIPQTYTDLVLVAQARTGGGSAGVIRYRLNGDNASNYSFTNFVGNGTSAASNRDASATSAAITNTIAVPDATSVFGLYIVNFQNYTNATTSKTAISRGSTIGNGAFNGSEVGISVWRKTPEAITSINILHGAGTQFAIGSTFTLYGIKAA